MTPSEVLSRFKPDAQVAAGMVIYALSDELSRLSADELAAFGVVIAGQASGWMEAAEVPHSAPRHEVDALATELLARLESACRWEEELDD